MTTPDKAAIGRLHRQSLADWHDMLTGLANPHLVSDVNAAGEALFEALAQGRSLWVAGNGGSAAMASHVAAEFAGKCVRDRAPLPAMSLADSSTAVTAIGNDYGFDQVFARGLRAMGRAGDVFLAMSTSGTSANIITALEVAGDLGLTRILLSGAGAPDTIPAEHILRAPSRYTPRIQEVHLMWTHAWCEAVDEAWATSS